MPIPSKDELLQAWGDPLTNEVVARLHRFAHIPQPLMDELAHQALTEAWGRDNYVLTKYLAVHLAWAVEQERFSSSQTQIYFTAGHLQTRYGTPLYLVFEPNRQQNRQPLYCVHIGSDVSAPELPTPPEIPSPPEIPIGAEIVMLHDHILQHNADRVRFLSGTPLVAQMCAVSGAIQWALNRNLQMSYWYFGRMNYLVPLYLQSREDITQAPDLIAPIQVNPRSLLVRTVLLPSMPYANARVAVHRHDQLPHWMLAAWDVVADQATQAEIDNPEPEPPNAG
jgi:hypothetical protein